MIREGAYIFCTLEIADTTILGHVPHPMKFSGYSSVIFRIIHEPGFEDPSRSSVSSRFEKFRKCNWEKRRGAFMIASFMGIHLEDRIGFRGNID